MDKELITPTQLQTIMATLGYELSAGDAKVYAPLLIQACNEWQVNTKPRVAALLGIIGYESGGLTTWEEIGGAEQEYAPYYGRGPIQLTWEGNYRAFGTAYGTPEKLAALAPYATIKRRPTPPSPGGFPSGA